MQNAVIVNPETIAAPIGLYSHLAIVPEGWQLLVIAGQLGNFADGRIASGIAAQYEQALRNIVAILAAANATPHDLIKLNFYLVEALDREQAATIRHAVLGDVLPPATLIHVPRLARPDLLVEIEAMAAKST